MTNSLPQLAQLKQDAANAVQRGQMEQAELIWTQVLTLVPTDQDGLFAMGFHAQMRGDAGLAIKQFRAAVEYSEPNPLLRLTLAKALKANGDIDGHFVAITAALDADPYYLAAHFLRAESLLEAGKLGAASQVYKDILQIVGPQENWPAALAPQLHHARKIADDYSQSLFDTLTAAIGGEAVDGKWREAVSIMAGQSKPFHADCNQLHVPRLPAIPFHDPYQFSWARGIEAQTAAITAELLAMLETQGDAFAPYIAYQLGDPVNQWATLNHSKRWSSLSLWRNGARDEANLAACPQTAAALAKVEMADIGGLCPNAMFSALAPHTEIPPHHGETNARLVVHLPLIVPPNCHYRVGFEKRQWEVGKLLVFDDTIEHTARNDSDELRVILIFDVWNPLLSLEERAMVQLLTSAARTFSAQ